MKGNRTESLPEEIFLREGLREDLRKKKPLIESLLWLRLASLRAWEKADFGPEARNRIKLAEKSILASPGNREKIAQKRGKMTRKPIFEPFCYFERFFPDFPGEAKIGLRRFFLDFGPEARNRPSPRHANSQTQASLPAYLLEVFGGLLGDPLGGIVSSQRLSVLLPLKVLPMNLSPNLSPAFLLSRNTLHFVLCGLM